ncbi:MAG: sulfatase-like hydrolase/transferase [Akkermansiaceae bacterium]
MKFLLTFILCIAGISSLYSAEVAPRPNILYFYVDDMGWGSIGPNGQAERKAKGLPYVRTPNLNRLAAKGVNFRRGYGCHVCSPARSSQQSGFHQGHTFADRNDPDNAKKAMRSDDILMGDALFAAGYTTGYWGKWGYGGSRDIVDPKIENIQTLPTSHGYQYALTELHHVRAHTFFQPSLWSAPAKKGAVGGLELIRNSMAKYANKENYPESPSYQSHPDYPKTGYCDDAYAFAALDFVRANAKAYRKNGKPFFALFAAQIPHAPFDEVSKLPKWNESYKDDESFADLPKQAQQWAAMVTRIDAHFGNILAALEDPNGDGDKSDSVAEDTLVIFQSDNGGPSGANNIVYDSNGGLRGNKGSIHEGGIRVPLIMRWPKNIKAGSSSDLVVDVTDLLPTFCELAGIKVPLGIDGVSIAPTLTGEGSQRKREFIIHEAGNGQSLIRGKDKLVRSVSGRKKKAGPVKFVLYDLEADHGEGIDLAATNPKIVEELKTILLGERVDEPRGFANTYHQWTGKNGALTSDASNWSDYQYANAGVIYTNDDGAPKLSWVAKIENKGRSKAVAKADADLGFLGLEISGGSSNAEQVLSLGSKVNLTGRNEIRLAKGGHLKMRGGTVSTLRWIDIAEGGRLSGHGKIVGDVYNKGTIVFDGKALEIEGEIKLGGTLLVKANLGKGSPFDFVPAIKSKSIRGAFDEVELDFPGSENYKVVVGSTGEGFVVSAVKKNSESKK